LRLAKPVAIAVDDEDRVYVLDAGTGEVHKLTAEGQPVARWPLPAESAAADLSGLAVDRQGHVYVADRRGRIVRLARDGRPLGSFEHVGLCARCPASPRGLAVDGVGNLYVADWSGPAVAKLSPDGALLAEWRGPEHFGLFHHPAAVAIGPGGDVYVADEGSHTLHALSPLGEPLGRWGREGSALGGLRGPRGLAVDPSGGVYVADTGNARVQRLSATGCWLAAWGSRGRGPGQLWSPTGVAVDRAGNVYVADEGNRRVLKLTPGGEPAAQWGPAGRLIVRGSVEVRFGAEAVPWQPGGLYYLESDDGPLAVGKVLEIDAVAVHLRLYQQRFARRVGDAKLPALTVDSPSEDGLGLAHLAVTPRLFAAWRPAFVRQSTKRPLPSDFELRPYRAWQQGHGGVWDLDVPLSGG
jgi:DNA-binding beta-propeller fold protein YncE